MCEGPTCSYPFTSCIVPGQVGEQAQSLPERAGAIAISL